MRFSILCILYIFLLRVYISGIASISAKSKLNEASQHVSDIELSDLQSKMVKITAENNDIKELLDILSQSKTSAQLDTILTIAKEYNPHGIDILMIGSDSITGYGPNLDIVTQFIKRLSDGLETAVDVQGILQLDLFEAAVGFELRF